MRVEVARAEAAVRAEAVRVAAARATHGFKSQDRAVFRQRAAAAGDPPFHGSAIFCGNPGIHVHPLSL